MKRNFTLYILAFGFVLGFVSGIAFTNYGADMLPSSGSLSASLYNETHTLPVEKAEVPIDQQKSSAASSIPPPPTQPQNYEYKSPMQALWDITEKE